MNNNLVNQFLTDLTIQEAAVINGGRRGRGADDAPGDDHGGRRGGRGRDGRGRGGNDDGPGHT